MERQTVLLEVSLSTFEESNLMGFLLTQGILHNFYTFTVGTLNKRLK